MNMIAVLEQRRPLNHPSSAANRPPVFLFAIGISTGGYCSWVSKAPSEGDVLLVQDPLEFTNKLADRDTASRVFFMAEEAARLILGNQTMGKYCTMVDHLREGKEKYPAWWRHEEVTP